MRSVAFSSRRGSRRPSFNRISIFKISASELKSLVCNRLNLLKFHENDYQALNALGPCEASVFVSLIFFLKTSKLRIMSNLLPGLKFYVTKLYRSKHI